jgi:hypothetical protein
MKGHTVRALGLIGIVIGVMAGGAVLLPTIASTGGAGDPRDLRLVVRDMTFYVEGRDEPNPTLRFRAGEHVRLVLKNEDAGLDHDFTIRAWNVRTKLLEGKGQDVVTFRVPAAASSETYECTPHAQMMRGTIDVE